MFPSEAGTRPVGNDQLNDVWREVQVMAGIDRPVTVHGIRHSFHDLARQQGVPDAVVKAMAGRAGTDVAVRGQDKHLHYSRGVTVEEMRQAWLCPFIRFPHNNSHGCTFIRIVSHNKCAAVRLPRSPSTFGTERRAV